MNNSLSFNVDEVVPGMILFRANDGSYENITFVVLGFTPATKHPGDESLITRGVVYMVIRQEQNTQGRVDVSWPSPGGKVFSKIAYALYPNDELES